MGTSNLRGAVPVGDTNASVYDGTQHGFHNDTTPRYDENAAKLAWQRTVDFDNHTRR